MLGPNGPGDGSGDCSGEGQQCQCQCKCQNKHKNGSWKIWCRDEDGKFLIFKKVWRIYSFTPFLNLNL